MASPHSLSRLQSCSLRESGGLTAVNRLGGARMRLWTLSATVLLAACVAGCGGGSTPVGIIVTSAGAGAGSTATVNVNGTVQFFATVSGTSTNTVFWQICLIPTIPGTQPTSC